MEKSDTKQIFFCSAASRYHQESLAGTAANYKGFIMVEHASPFPENPVKGFLDTSWLKKLQTIAVNRRYKLLLIRNSQSNYKTSRIIYVDCILQKYFELVSPIADIHKIDLEYYVAHEDTVWDTTPFFVICTNGKKDKCCAKFGLPVFKFFENIHLPFCYTSWECTHLGGDRFAANAALMPYGIYYGRIGVEDVHEIIKQTAFGRVYQANYRGLSRLSFFEQAVESHLRAFLSNYNINFQFHLSNRKRTGHVITLNVCEITTGCFEMTLHRNVIDYPYPLTCSSIHPEKLVKYDLVQIRKL